MYNVVFSIEKNDGEKERLVDNKLTIMQKTKMLENAFSAFYRQKVEVVHEN